MPIWCTTASAVDELEIVQQTASKAMCQAHRCTRRDLLLTFYFVPSMQERVAAARFALRRHIDTLPDSRPHKRAIEHAVALTQNDISKRAPRLRRMWEFAPTLLQFKHLRTHPPSSAVLADEDLLTTCLVTRDNLTKHRSPLLHSETVWKIPPRDLAVLLTLFDYNVGECIVAQYYKDQPTFPLDRDAAANVCHLCRDKVRVLPANPPGSLLCGDPSGFRSPKSRRPPPFLARWPASCLGGHEHNNTKGHVVASALQHRRVAKMGQLYPLGLRKTSAAGGRQAGTHAKTIFGLTDRTCRLTKQNPSLCSPEDNTRQYTRTLKPQTTTALRASASDHF